MTDTTAGEGVVSFKHGGCRVQDIAYTAFMMAKQPNDEDGGPSDWFNDTWPTIKALIAAQPSAGAQEEAWKPTTDELANCREAIAEAREGMKRMMGDNVPSSMTEVMIEADWLEKVCDHFATPAQPDTGEIERLNDQRVEIFKLLLNDAGVMVAPGEESNALRRYIEQNKSQPDTGDVAALREALFVWDGYGGNSTIAQVVEEANALAEAARSVLAALSKPNAPGAENPNGIAVTVNEDRGPDIAEHRYSSTSSRVAPYVSAIGVPGGGPNGALSKIVSVTPADGGA